MVRAWTEPNTVIKFLSFFIVLEILLQGITAEAPQQDPRLKLLNELIDRHAGPDKDELRKFIELNAKRAAQTSLLSRFMALAGIAKLEGADADIETFRRLNKLRNQILHRGEDRLKTVESLQQKDLAKMQGLAERYALWRLKNA